jgi:hypothetical protein
MSKRWNECRSIDPTIRGRHATKVQDDDTRSRQHAAMFVVSDEAVA